MKKLFLMLGITFAALSCFSQGKWSAGISYQPGVSDMIHPSSNYFDDTVNITTSEKYSYSSGLFIAYKINAKLQVRLGANFTKMGFKWTCDKSYYSNEAWKALTDASPNLLNWEKTKLSANYYFIGVPLDICYNVYDDKIFEVYIKGGSCIYFSHDGDWSTSAKYTDHTEEQNNNKTPYANNRDYRFCYQFGFGLSYNPTNHIKIFLEPTYQQITDKVKNVFPIEGYLYNTGVNIGLQYKFSGYISN